MTGRSGGLVLLAALITPGNLPAQDGTGYAAYPSAGSKVVSVVPGARYRAGPLHRTLLGAHYRDLWTTPVQVPVLDLGSFAGGLKPEERGGGKQTRSLHFEAADGREYSFRSLDKDPSEALPEPFRRTVVDRLVQDATSAMNPGGALVAPVLLDAAGVLHAPPRLVVMPDDPRLGQYRGEFSGKLGTIEERPDGGFAGAIEVDDSEELFERLRKTPAHRVDAAGFLTARLVDHLLGDWDRHQDQWNWAAYPNGTDTLWRPIPRDRDQALARYDGWLLALARKANPKLAVFGPELPRNPVGLTWNGRALDRPLLAVLNRAEFDSVARALQAALTDTVIDAAVRRLPAAHHARRGPWIAEALRRRRDGLRQHAERYYRYLATDVDVWGTDAAEHAEARWDDHGLLLLLRREPDGPPWFERRFLAAETEEVRLHLRQGTDRVLLAGAGAAPRLRIIREPRDSITGPTGATPVRLHDHLPEPASGDSTSESAAPETPRDWGSELSAGPHAGYDADLGLLLGARAGWTDFAFRHDPYRSRSTLSVAYASAADGLLAELHTEIRHTAPRNRLRLLVRASEIDVVRFSGLGNETPDLGSAAEVALWRLTLAADLERDLSPSLRLRVGPRLEYATTDSEAGTVVRETRPLGAGGFGRLGAAGELSYQGPVLRATGGAAAYPPIWSGTETYGTLQGEAGLEIGLAGPTVAARLGGKRVWGPFPYDAAAYLGGAGTLRGYDYQRFAGEGMLYGGVELRVPMLRILPRTIPTRIGVIGLGDAGRVWAEDAPSDRIHAAAGGGFWLEFFEPRHALSVVHASGREGGRWYLQLGLPY